jgi:pimeloyl-ACP methyl ester carboxylesterase
LSVHVYFEIFFCALGLCLLLLLSGWMYQIAGVRRDLVRHPPPGKCIDLETHRLHLLQTGNGHASAPTILLESGLMSTVLCWERIREELGKSFRVVSYDRAGLGWSDAGPNPRTVDRLVEELHTLLARAGIASPFVLVGHSFGGLIMSLFAARYPLETAGMVLVDPVAPAEWNPPSSEGQRWVAIGSRVCRRARLLARFGLIRFVAFLVTSPAKKVADSLVRLISRGAPAGSGTLSSPLFWNLPPSERSMARIFWVQDKFCDAIGSQVENLPASAARVWECGNFCDKPVVILSAGAIPPLRLQEHAALAQRLPQGRHLVAANSSHWIMEDQPELVIAAIREVAQSAPALADASPGNRTAPVT